MKAWRATSCGWSTTAARRSTALTNDRIEIGIVTESEHLTQAIEENREYIMSETQADRLVLEALAGVEGIEHELAAARLVLYVRVV